MQRRLHGGGTLGALALAVLVSACGQEKRQPEGGPSNAIKPQPQLPLLLRQPTTARGLGDSKEQVVRGVLDLTGTCVRLQDGQGKLWTVVTSADPHVGRDYAGLYLLSDGERLRHGSSVIGRGAALPSVPDLLIDAPAPEACRSDPVLKLFGMHRYDPADSSLPSAPQPTTAN